MTLQRPGAQATGSTPPRWEAALELGFERREQRTVLARRRHVGPLVVQRPFHPEPDGTCHVIVLHPPGGVAGGDTLRVRASVGAGGSALLTAPAAQKLYRGFGREARLEQQLRVAEGARLEWLPLETIAFDGAEAEAALRVELAPGAAFVGWEITCLGRPAAGERFTSGRLRQRWEVTRAGQPLFRELACYRGGGSELRARWGLGGQPVVGLMLCAAPDLGRGDWLVEELRAAAADADFVASQLADAVVCRYLGASVERAQNAFRAAWRRLRAALWQSEASPPRIWST